MILYLRSALFLFLIPVFLYSCTSSAEKKYTKILTDAELDSIALIYDPQDADPRYEEFIMRLHNRSGFNGNVLVAKNGKILYQKAIGWADYLHRDSLKINSVFELASVSKPFTAMAIMMLI